ncbi:MAG: hypothetical protein CVU52_04815 [Deltaproteobacteria bacterium HGW-Deltaproteobacteria-10]|nr:MAG: hypothetical protein CVU52_04815 [Deltaproteobacteria bacterium HGW-Deltaproteobacteria-10]
MFGAPQTVSRQSGGLNTAIGYWYHEDIIKNGSEYIIRQNEVYSQVSYGAGNRWEIYGRIGVSDLKISDAYRSTNAATITSSRDLTENWKFFGTLGAKGFLPINKILGVGVFIQGTYYFNNFSGDVTGTNAGVPFAADLKVLNMWDVNAGVALQATVPHGIKLYAGPYVYYSEAKACMSANIPGIGFGTESILLKNKTSAGGFIGANMPLAKGFHLNIEGQYSERFSMGAAIIYVY